MQQTLVYKWTPDELVGRKMQIPVWEIPVVLVLCLALS